MWLHKGKVFLGEIWKLKKPCNGKSLYSPFQLSATENRSLASFVSWPLPSTKQIARCRKHIVASVCEWILLTVRFEMVHLNAMLKPFDYLCYGLKFLLLLLFLFFFLFIFYKTQKAILVIHFPPLIWTRHIGRTNLIHI